MPDKIIIREVPSNDPDYNDLEGIVDYFENLASPYGTPYKIYRITSQGTKEAYTNSLIFNNMVLVPFSSSSNDAPALEVYKEAMPGYIVKGYTYSGWKNYDALHCRVMGITNAVEMQSLSGTFQASGNHLLAIAGYIQG